MKKMMITLSVFMMFLSMSILIGQVPVPIPLNKIHTTGGGGGNFSPGGNLVVDRCQLTGIYNLSVSNIELYHEQTQWEDCIENVYYPFPANFPQMYLRFRVNGIEMETVEVLEFKAKWCPDNDNLNNPAIYMFSHEINYSVDEACLLKEGEGLDFTVELLTNKGSTGQYIMYSTCNYMEPGSLFDCNAHFTEAEIFCASTSNAPCEDAILANFSYEETTLSCDSCISESVGKPRSENFEGHEQSKKLGGEVNNLFQISPNPFVSSLVIHWEESIENAVIQLYDLQGRLIYSLPEGNYEAQERLELEIISLSSGIYYLQVQNGKTSECMKLVKI